jgi:hypothetical protein
VSFFIAWHIGSNRFVLYLSSKIWIEATVYGCQSIKPEKSLRFEDSGFSPSYIPLTPLNIRVTQVIVEWAGSLHHFAA